MHTKIIGTGSYLPPKIVTNDDLSKVLDTSDEWIATRTGIRQRHIADIAQGESGVKMATAAALRALQMAKLSPSDIDLIIFATVSPDYRLPSNACLLHYELGLAQHAPAFDLQAACAGSVYALSMANAFIRSGTYRRILVVTGELMSSVIDPSDRNTAVLFGDGASAAILSVSDQAGFIDFDLYADGKAKDIISIPEGGALHPLNASNIDSRYQKIQMNGRETYKFAVRAMCEAAEKIIADNGFKLSDISFVVPHQANLRIIEGIAKRLELPLERFLINLDRCANTSAASLLLAYDEASRNQRLKANDLVLSLAIGAGFVWGAGLYRV